MLISHTRSPAVFRSLKLWEMSTTPMWVKVASGLLIYCSSSMLPNPHKKSRPIHKSNSEYRQCCLSCPSSPSVGMLRTREPGHIKNCKHKTPPQAQHIATHDMCYVICDDMCVVFLLCKVLSHTLCTLWITCIRHYGQHTSDKSNLKRNASS